MEPSPSRERFTRLQLILASSGLTLVLAYWLKARCLKQNWNGSFEFRNYCYTDYYIHYGSYGFNQKVVPYVTHWNEYPALNGAFQFIISRLVDNVHDWWVYHAVSLFVFAMAATYALYRMGHDWKSAAPWVLGPTVLISGFTNYDMWPIGFMALGLWMFTEKRLGAAGLLLGLGAAAKLFPGFVWPPLVVALLNEARLRGVSWRDPGLYRKPARLTAGFLLGLVPINLVFLVQNPDVWMQTWRFQRERGTTFETIYYLFDQLVLQKHFQYAMTNEQMNIASALLFFGGSAAILLWALRKKTVDWATLSLAVVALYLLTTKVYSTQHSMWILLPIVVARMQRWPWVVFAAADIIGFVWLYQFFAPPLGETGGRSFEFIPVIQLAVAVRLAALAAMLYVSLRRIQREPAPPPSPQEPPAQGPEPTSRAPEPTRPEPTQAPPAGSPPLGSPAPLEATRPPSQPIGSAAT